MAKSGMSDVDSQNDGKQKSQSMDMKKSEPKSSSANIVSKPVKATTSISILIESLVKNLCAVYEPNEAKAHEIYNFICDKLFTMRLIDESYTMNEFEGMRNQYQRALRHLLTAARGGEQPVALQPTWLTNDITNEWSHYHREFDEVEYIAGGGFGQVFRVKHKLDSSEYAVKKIYIRSEGIKSVMNYLSEVKTFASLNHANIVQYKAAWLELGATTSSNILTEQSSDSEYPYTNGEITNSLKTGEHIEDDYIYPNVITDVESSVTNVNKDQSSDFEVSFESSLKTRHYSYSNNNISTDKKAVRKRVKRNSISEGGKVLCCVDFKGMQNMQIQTRNHPKWATLYIQMALCQSTLKQWLEKRNMTEYINNNKTALIPVKNQVRNKTIMEILKQLLRGLEYIHSKRIVHHDIKPSNIFIQIENAELLVQLGDFGLACPLQSARHSLALGTKLYAAPEQLLGKCDPKSDMYSLGIVLLELVETFSTDMERVRTITELRKGNMPSHLLAQEPQIAHIISQLVIRDPGERPDATTLLKRISVDNNESELVRELKSQLTEKDEEILRLKELLKNAGITTA